MSRQPRVQAPNVRPPEKLRSTPLQSDTFVRPQVPTDVVNIADSLQHLNRALVGYGSSARNNDQVPSRWTGMTNEQVTEDIKKGGGDVATDVAQQNYGERKLAEFKRQLDTSTTLELDKYDGNYEPFMRSKAKEYMEQNPMSKAALHSFTRGFESYIPQRQASWVVARNEQSMTERYNNLPYHFDQLIETSKAEGLSPKEIAAKVWQSNSEAITTMKLDPLKAESVVMEKAKALAAAGDVDLLDALLSDPRGGLGSVDKKASTLTAAAELRAQASRVALQKQYDATWKQDAELKSKVDDGEASPTEIENAPLTPSQKSAYAHRNKENRQRAVLKAIDTARKESGALEFKIHEQEYFRDAVTSANNGTFHNVGERRVTNSLGETKTLKPTDTVDILESTLDREVAAGTMTKEQAETTRLKFYTNSGLTSPKWQRELNVGANAATIPNIMGGDRTNKPAITESTKKGYARFKQLKATSPGSLARQGMSADASNLYERAYNFQETTGLSEPEAIAMARATIEEEKGNSSSYIDSGYDDTTILNKIRSQRSGWMPFFGKNPEENLSAFIPAIRDKIQMYRRSGSDINDATTKALTWLDENHFEVNGALIRKSGNLPTDAEELFKGLLGVYAEKHGKEEGIESADDLTVRKNPNSDTWLIFNKRSGTFVSSGEQNMKAIDSTTMNSYRVFRAQETSQGLQHKRSFFNNAWGLINPVSERLQDGKD